LTKEEFKKIFDKYFDPVRNYVYYRSGDTDLATDIAQDVFIKIWEKQLKLVPETTVGLLYKIANDLFISWYRKGKVENKYINSIQLQFYNDESPEDTMQYEELKNNYEKALGDMKEKQRVVFLMNRMDNLTYNEIAKRLNISVKAVEKRMKYALDYLKTTLET